MHRRARNSAIAMLPPLAVRFGKEVDMKIRNVFLALPVALMIAVAGCASKSASVYSREDAQREMTVRMGTVESVRAITIDGTKSPVGAGAGAIVGGIAGSTVGQG